MTLSVRTTLLALILSLAIWAQQQAQGPLTDQRIVDLGALGVGTPEIVRIIASAAQVNFDLSPAATQGMLNAGVSEEIIKAMAARENGTLPKISTVTVNTPARAAPEAASSTLGPSPVSEVGVYYRANDGWAEIMPEVVNWKTGGVLKSVSTAFIIKEDVNGRLRGGKSRTKLNRPVDFLVYALEGTQITEYQLIHLRRHANAREFRTVTGGVFHVSGDSNRDVLPFEYQHVAQRTWTLHLGGLEPGEYGLLPPGAVEARSASAQLGKIYTFTIGE